MKEEPTEREILWRQYSLNIDLYKYYLDIVLKINAFFYLITGSILTFYFANSKEPLSKFSLLLPTIMSVAFGGIFIYGSILLKVVREEIFSIRNKLNLEVAPDVQVLVVILRVFAAVFFLVAISMILIMVFKEPTKL